MLIVGTPGDDVLFGLPANDEIRGSAGNDILVGGDGNDNIAGGDGNDVIRGGDGSDTLIGSAGNDHLAGGAGGDTFRFDYSFGFESGIDTVADFVLGEDLLDIRVPGVITHTNLELVVEFQQFIVDLNAETSDGSFAYEAGSDLLLRFSDTNVVRLSGLADEFVVGSGGNDVLVGGAGRDIIGGGPGNDMMNGGGGNDRLLGNGGNDVISGGDDRDTLLGGAGNDVIRGGNATDSLSGDAGNDHLAGGAGGDTFVFQYFPGSFFGAEPDSGFDTIADFVVGEDALLFAFSPRDNNRLETASDIQSFIDDMNADVGDGSFASEAGDDLLLRFSNTDVVRISGLAGDFVI